MNLSITLNDEASDAIDKRVAEHNTAVDARNAQLDEGAEQEPHLDAVGYMELRNARIVAGWVKADYAAAVKRLGEVAATLDYTSRNALIASIESQIPVE